MHILLTDLATCPRCGPEWGLILLADEIADRNVIQGRLGCANCREEYPIHHAVADLRLGGDRPHPPPEATTDPERALRLAALLGVTRGGGWILLVGGGSELANSIRALVPEIEFARVAGTEDAQPQSHDSNLILADRGVPLRGGTVRGVALASGADAALLAEAARVVAPGGRVVVEGVEGSGPEVRGRAAAAGLDILLEDAGTLVAARTGVAPGFRQS